MNASGGRLEIKYFPGGSIVPIPEHFDAVDRGVIDFCHDGPGTWKDRYPVAPLLTYMVGGLSAFEYTGWLYAGGGSELIQRMIQDSNVHYVPGSGWVKPPEIFMHSNTPVNKPADISGLKIRAYGDGAEVLGKMGGSMVFIPGLEIYESMQRGVIDAFECSTATTNWALALQEVAKYVYISDARQPTEYSSYIVNKASWAALPDDLKLIVEERWKGELLRVYFELLASDWEYVEKFREYGNEVLFLSPEIEDEIVRVAEEFYDERRAEDPFAAEIIDSQRAYQKSVRATVPRL